LGGAQYELLTLFADGGWMMYPLVLCSLIALGVIIAKAWILWVAHRGSRKVMAEVEEVARAGRIDEAIEIAAASPGPAAAILLAGLRRIQRATLVEGEMEQAINTTGTIELGFLERGLVVLATVANVAPLLGFLGTVTGMILAFASIEQSGSVDPALVAGGIKVALLTTATGLTIAIPVNIAYNYFVTRVDSLILDMEQGAQQILNLAWDMENEGRITVVGREEHERTFAPAGVSAPSAPAAPPAEEPGGASEGETRGEEPAG